MAEPNKAKIQSLQTGLEIIDLIASQQRPMNLNEIHHHTKMTKSNLYKYLNTLTDLGLLYREKSKGLYMLGSKLIKYGMVAIDRENLVERIDPFLQEINYTCRETVILSVWTHDGPISVKIINGNRRINISANLGGQLPIHSATGKIFAAFQDGDEVQLWIDKETALYTTEEKERLNRELEQIKRDHIAFAKDAFFPQVYSVSIPVFNFEEKLVAAITLVGFENSMPKDKGEPLSQCLFEMKDEISHVFGYES
mgnify:CR=1 FL=1